jgi:hypothetical protein
MYQPAPARSARPEVTAYTVDGSGTDAVAAEAPLEPLAPFRPRPPPHAIAYTSAALSINTPTIERVMRSDRIRLLLVSNDREQFTGRNCSRRVDSSDAGVYIHNVIDRSAAFDI